MGRGNITCIVTTILTNHCTNCTDGKFLMSIKLMSSNGLKKVFYYLECLPISDKILSVKCIIG